MSVFPFSNYSSWCLIALHSFPKQLLGHGDLNGNAVIALLLDKTGHLARENQVDRLLPLAKGFLCCLIHAKWISLCLCLLPNREHSTDSGILITPWKGKWGSRDGFLKSGGHVNHWLEEKRFPSGMVVKLGANSLPPSFAAFRTIEITKYHWKIAYGTEGHMLTKSRHGNWLLE